ncbi:MAG TPA: DUF1616 domain-containing protein [Thermoplasmata archaeon]|nr:DUF1616 domain-containing protein [Thermoplasmata archaeon]
MGALDPVEAAVGLALLFFLPGFAVGRAMFPEWRFRGPGGTIHLIETLALSLVLSVALTVVVGYALLTSSLGFGSTWSNPNVLESLGVVTIVGLGVAVVRGAFSATAPEGPSVPSERGSEVAFETIRELDGLVAAERRLRHRLRVLPRDDPERPRVDRELGDVVARQAAVVAAREEDERAG